MTQHTQPTQDVTICRSCVAPLPPSGTGPFAVTLLYCAPCSALRAAAALEAAVTHKLATWARHRQFWLDHSGLPDPAIGTKTLSTFDPKRSPAARAGYAAAAEWAKAYQAFPLAPPAWLVLHGQSNGTGKTHLLYAVLQAVLNLYVPTEADIRQQEQAAQDAAPASFRQVMQVNRPRAGCPVLCYEAWELVLAVMEARRPKAFTEPPSETEYALMQRLITVPVLGIDDWGRVRSRRDMEEQHHIWYAIVDGRDKRGLPIVATSNVAREGLTPIIGTAAADRLFGRAVFVPMEGQSERGRAS